jgi:hypothetical protein
MKKSDISESLLVRKCGVRRAEVCGRIWFGFMYVLLTAITAASWVLAPELASSRGDRILLGCLVGGLTVLAASVLTRMHLEYFDKIRELEKRGVDPVSATGRRERSLKWIIAAGLVASFLGIGAFFPLGAPMLQGWDAPLALRLLIGYGRLGIPVFGMVAAATWVLCDVYFRGRWVQWLLFSIFALLILCIYLGFFIAGGFFTTMGSFH